MEDGRWKAEVRRWKMEDGRKTRPETYDICPTTLNLKQITDNLFKP